MLNVQDAARQAAGRHTRAVRMDSAIPESTPDVQVKGSTLSTGAAVGQARAMARQSNRWTTLAINSNNHVRGVYTAVHTSVASREGRSSVSPPPAWGSGLQVAGQTRGLFSTTATIRHHACVGCILHLQPRPYRPCLQAALHSERAEMPNRRWGVLPITQQATRQTCCTDSPPGGKDMGSKPSGSGSGSGAGAGGGG